MTDIVEQLRDGF
jgi:hypothetical protein